MSRATSATPRHSSLCEGWVSHHRRSGPRHAFRYRLFLTLLDLDELPGLDRELRLFGHGTRRPVSFRDRDHLAGSGRGIRADLADVVRQSGHAMPDGRVELLTHCRVLGYVFNPVSVFYCYDPEGRFVLAVAEVNNTFGDRHSYVLPVRDSSFEHRVKKLMHVSPFFQPDAGSYRFELPPPSRQVSLAIDLTQGGETLLAARLQLVRRPLTDRALASALLRFPLVTAKVIGAIHFEALRLRARGARYWSRPDYNPELARGGPA